jgi:hypothetical protein
LDLRREDWHGHCAQFNEPGMEVYVCVSRHGFVANSRWFEEMVGQPIRALAASLPAEVVESVQQQGRVQDWDVMATELLSELQPFKEVAPRDMLSFNTSCWKLRFRRIRTGAQRAAKH